MATVGDLQKAKCELRKDSDFFFLLYPLHTWVCTSKCLKYLAFTEWTKLGRERHLAQRGPVLKQGWSRCRIGPGQNWSELWRGKVFLTSPWSLVLLEAPFLLNCFWATLLCFPYARLSSGKTYLGFSLWWGKASSTWSCLAHQSRFGGQSHRAQRA